MQSGRKRSNAIEIKHGPKFTGAMSSIGLLAAVGSLMYGGWLLTEGQILDASVMLLMSVPFAAIFLDFRGVQIDAQNRMIREYRSFLGYHHGQWESISDFNKLRLKWERMQSTSATNNLTGSRRSSTSDAYCVVLEGNDVVPFEIGEYGTYKSARKVLLKMQTALKLEVKDDYQKRLESAKKRRQELENRRGIR